MVLPSLKDGLGLEPLRGRGSANREDDQRQAGGARFDDRRMKGNAAGKVDRGAAGAGAGRALPDDLADNANRTPRRRAAGFLMGRRDVAWLPGRKEGIAVLVQFRGKDELNLREQQKPYRRAVQPPAPVSSGAWSKSFHLNCLSLFDKWPRRDSGFYLIGAEMVFQYASHAEAYFRAASARAWSTSLKNWSAVTPPGTNFPLMKNVGVLATLSFSPSTKSSRT